jgi:hypothetical protein
MRALENQFRFFNPRGICFCSPAASPICLDSQQNVVSCEDTDCQLGPCGGGTVANSQTGSSGCLDSDETCVDCSSPSCTYGDCSDHSNTSPAKVASTTGSLASAASGNAAPGNGGVSTSPLVSATLIGSLTQAATSAYAATLATQTTPKPITIGSASLGSSSSLFLVGAVVVVAIILLKK